MKQLENKYIAIIYSISKHKSHIHITILISLKEIHFEIKENLKTTIVV